MTAQNLEQLIESVGNPVDMLRNAQAGPNVYPGVPPEFTNWRDEQEAWQHTCVMYDLSYHMVDWELRGPDALKLLSHVGFNSFENFHDHMAKQLAPCSPDGYVIGDVILFNYGNDTYNLVGRIPTINWVQYHADTGGFDVEYELDQRTAMRTDGRRKSYRLQIQGPNAMALMEKALGEAPPDVRFFHTTTLQIAGRTVNALRHGMAGQPGFELYGPWDDKDPVQDALIAAGEEFGMPRVGGRAYSTNTLDSGWIPSPLPAVYSGDSMKAYREWLPVTGYEANASLGGSFVSDDVSDYYFTPWDLGYGRFVRFDHDFVGREALEKMAENPPRREVTLELDDEDVAKVVMSQYGDGPRGKFIEFPSAVYSYHPYDLVLSEGEQVGVSTWVGYSTNARKMLTLAVLDNEYAEPGTEVTFVWGEPDGGTRKPTVESHEQMELRATVCPVPYEAVARDSYRAD